MQNHQGAWLVRDAGNVACIAKALTVTRNTGTNDFMHSYLFLCQSVRKTANVRTEKISSTRW